MWQAEFKYLTLKLLFAYYIDCFQEKIREMITFQKFRTKYK